MRVWYRGRDDGWVLTANKRGPILLPVDGDNASAASAFDAQEASYAAAAAAATAAAAAPSGDDDDRPLTGAKPGGVAAAPPAPPAAGGQDAGAGLTSSGWKAPVDVGDEGKAGLGSEYMTSLG